MHVRKHVKNVLLQSGSIHQILFKPLSKDLIKDKLYINNQNQGTLF